MSDQDRITGLERTVKGLSALITAQQTEILRLCLRVERLTGGKRIVMIEHLVEQSEARLNEIERNENDPR